MERQQLELTIDRLIIDKANVRKRGPGQMDDDALEASILSHGLLMPLAVRSPQKGDADLMGDRYRIIAGGRRYSAIARLIEAGKIKADFLVPVMLREDLGDAEAGEASLAENIIRVGMRPVEEVKAFRDLRESGLNAGEIAFRFGVAEKFIRQRLALADLHPKILDALDEGTITIEHARAYTLGSQADQIALFDSDNYDKRWPENIRRQFIGEKVRSESTIAKTITRDRYIAAGGVVQSDLFGDNEFWESKDVIDKIKAEIIEEIKAKALADGWAWCETKAELGKEIYQLDRVYAKPLDTTTDEQKARMAAIEEALEEYQDMDQEEAEADANFVALTNEYSELDKLSAVRDFSDTQRRSAGVAIGDDLSISEGILKPGAADPDRPDSVGRNDSSEKEPKNPLAPSAALQERLSKTLTNAVREAILKDTHVALAFLAAALSAQVNQFSVATASHIEHKGHPHIEGEKTSFANEFKLMLLLDDAGIIEQLVEHVSSSVDVSDPFLNKQGYGFRGAEVELLRETLVNATKADPVAHFDARDFFQSSSKAVIEAAMKEMDEVLAPGKKESLVNQAEAFAQRYGWLPELLRFDGYKLNKPAPIEHKKGPTLEKKTKDQHNAKIAFDVTKGLPKPEKPAAKPKGAKAIKVDDDVIAVLADQVEIVNERWLAFKTQLDRKLYDKVMKVLKSFGGTWHRMEQKHSFPEPVGPIIEELIQTGQYSRTKQDFGQFDTPEDLADQVVEWAEIEPDMKVLEPSAGIGRLALRACVNDAFVFAVELDEKRAAMLRELVDEKDSIEILDGIDFLEVEPAAMPVYDRVIMNPPFAGQADIDHVLHAWEFLKTGGVIVAIMSPSFQFRSNKKSVDFRKFMDDHQAEVREIDGGAFKESGTMIKTIMVKIRKLEGE